MSNPVTPSHSSPETAATNVTPSFEDRLQMMWENNHRAIWGVLVAIVVAILAWNGWEYFAGQRELHIEDAYAAAGTSEKLKAFAAENPGHSLAGVAQLRLADEAYAANRPTDAVAAYERAIPILANTALVSRAKLGLAMARLAAGQKPEAEKALTALAADEKESKAVRTEAAYQLTVMAAADNRAEDVKKFSEQVMSIDPTSPWTQRVMMLRTRFPGEMSLPGIDLGAGEK